MSTIEEVKEVSIRKIKELGLPASKYVAKLKREVEDLESWKKYKQIDKAGELLRLSKKIPEPKDSNKSNSLVLFLLGISTVDPVKNNLDCKVESLTSGDPPDIDTDFDTRIRDQVKNRIVEMFGEQNTCSIGSYQTYKTRAVIIDVARALGYDVWEAMEVTKKIDTLATFEVETDDGDIAEMNVDKMSFDDVCKQYPELGAYFEKHPDVRQHSEVIRNQVKNMGQHAGGVIISNLNLQNRIPVVKTKHGIVSSWVEGQASHELSEVGLVKFDVLALGALPVIDDALKLIEKNYGIKMTRRDIPINDRESIKLGSHDDLVGIFQLDSPQTKPISDAVVLESLNDISALTSLIRPGPKDMGMHMMYARRKNGEPYDMPDFLREHLQETFGVICYQEQVMQVAQHLSYFTPSEANLLRKAMGKKIAELMTDMKRKFIDGARPRVDRGEITEEEVSQIFDLIESFAGYGFNKCLALDSVVESKDGLKLLDDVVIGDFVLGPTEHGDEFVEVTDVIDTGEKEIYEVFFDSGKVLRCTMEHELLCEDGVKRPLFEVLKMEMEISSLE